MTQDLYYSVGRFGSLQKGTIEDLLGPGGVEIWELPRR